jgi:hypothetical protein
MVPRGQLQLKAAHLFSEREKKNRKGKELTGNDY